MRLEPPFVLLEDRLSSPASARLYVRPLELVRCETPEGVGAALDRLEAGLARGLHAAGYLAYELGHVLEPRLEQRLPGPPTGPLLHMGLFAPPAALARGELDALFAALGPPPPVLDLCPVHDRPTHVAKVRRILELIASGDIYQANLTFPIRFRYEGGRLQLYGALRVRQPTAHCALVALDDAWVLSASPELFLRVRRGCAESRPMKGTVARSGDAEADRAAALALRADPKQRAENIMIVDLIRNDLARIAEPGSVQVSGLLAIESYPDLHTLTSTVVARLRPGLSLRERLAAVFPCGSIVGAPKIRAAERLAELEGAARGVYTGAIGAFAPDGDIDLSVAIRTAEVKADGHGVYGVGGGVVADSDPDAEYDEALLKARLLQDLANDYQLIETLRWAPASGFVRLQGHLGRMQRSAALLDFAFDRRDVEAALARGASAWASTHKEARRVRILLSRRGALSVEDGELVTGDTPVRAGIVGTRLDAGDPFLRHKTTRRGVYDKAAAEAAGAGWGEALILNRAGEVADASRHSVFVLTDGRLLTPPLASGALPGVLRDELLRGGQACEARLGPADLEAGEALFLGNSLRGLTPARLIHASFA